MREIEKKLWDFIMESIKKHATSEHLPKKIFLETKTNIIFRNSKEFEKAMLFIVEKFDNEENINFSLGIAKDELFTVIETVEDIFLYFHLQINDINEMIKKLMDDLGKK